MSRTTPRRHAGSIRRAAIGVVLLVAGLGGCPPRSQTNDDPNTQTSDNASAASLLYVLQPESLTTEAFRDAGFDWLVLEPSRTGDAAGEFTAAEIESIRSGGPCGPTTVLAYLSIGEAEDYRDYWDATWVAGEGGPPIAGVAPAWLGPTNPDWPGNYEVRYWDAGWQALIRGTTTGPNRTPLDRIINAGYDGVYLDIVDAFEFWSDTEQGYAELSRAEARRRMIDWVLDIAAYARTTRGRADFLVFPQNGEEIIYDDDGALDADGERYLAAISGIGIEDLYYDETMPVDAATTTRRETVLSALRSRGKTVLVTDYLVATPAAAAVSGARVADFYSRAKTAGFIPYAALENRDLDTIVTLSANEWPVAQPPACAAE